MNNTNRRQIFAEIDKTICIKLIYLIYKKYIPQNINICHTNNWFRTFYRMYRLWGRNTKSLILQPTVCDLNHIHWVWFGNASDTEFQSDTELKIKVHIKYNSSANDQEGIVIIIFEDVARGLIKNNKGRLSNSC